MRPRLGVHLQNFSASPDADWSRLVEVAVAADRSGIGYIVVSDHVLFGERLDDYANPQLGGVSGGSQPTGPDGAWLEPVAVLAFLAAHTERVRLATHVLLAALRRPTVLAKQLATVDVLSGGRLDIGVGVGWQRAEYEASGLDFNRRGELLDAALDTCTALWRGAMPGVHQMPRPVQPDGVPIWISGTDNDRVARRLARHGAGWIPWGRDAERLGDVLPELRDRVAAAGGDPAFRVVARAVDSAGLAQAVAAGATDVTVRLRADTGNVEAELTAWVTELGEVAPS
ncbi:MAG TPA: TIGR03619 family F420-dependent LLM class oxidoreductase [Ilumatobacter sp.]|nr:TIGR03619 family F420-dependent LLM class oxidoreductase [Ilumatobacter sp.]